MSGHRFIYTLWVKRHYTLFPNIDRIETPFFGIANLVADAQTGRPVTFDHLWPHIKKGSYMFVSLLSLSLFICCLFAVGLVCIYCLGYTHAKSRRH